MRNNISITKYLSYLLYRIRWFWGKPIKVFPVIPDLAEVVHVKKHGDLFSFYWDNNNAGRRLEFFLSKKTQQLSLLYWDENHDDYTVLATDTFDNTPEARKQCWEWLKTGKQPTIKSVL